MGRGKRVYRANMLWWGCRGEVRGRTVGEGSADLGNWLRVEGID